MKAALTGLGYNADNLTILFLQMVSLFRSGETVKMSKRAGTAVPIEELIADVGVDAARYFFVMRSMDSQLDFDIDLAKKESSENPVYYIQYAHARIASIRRQAAENGIAERNDAELSLLTDESEIELIKKIEEYPEEIERAAKDYAPQRVARFAHDIAGLFHSFYTKRRIIGVAKEEAEARLALVVKAQQVIRHALAILGVSAPEKM